MDETLTPLTMPTKTKTSARKGEKPQAVNVRDIHPKTLKALNLMGQARHDTLIVFVRALQSSVDRIESLAMKTAQGQIDQAKWIRSELTALEQSAKPTDPPPAEKWIPKVGDWVVVSENTWQSEACKGQPLQQVIQPSRHPAYVWITSKTDFYKFGLCCGKGDAMREVIRPATPEEIAEHKRSEEARLKSEAEARELAMPLEFGTRVKVKGREEENWRIACDEPTDDGYWRLAPPKCGNLNTMTAKRSEFTIIP